MPAPAAPLITLNDLCLTIEGRQVLSNISFETVARRIGVVGRNGSGKTSLARLMAGITTPDQGKVRIDGFAVAQNRKAALGTVGILFQNPDHQIIFPTVEEELAFGLRQMGLARGEAAQEVARVLATFDRSHWANAAIHQLSQGQRQLVCLMAVLAMRPKVILLDEPFAGLDIPTALRLSRRLDALPQTLVQITHDPAAVQHYDVILWLEAGRVVQSGPPAKVLPAFTSAMQEAGGTDDLAYLAG